MNTINGEIRILTASLSIPWVGMWILDADIDPGTPVIPSGTVTVTLGASTLIGKVDARASGKFGERYAARIVGGLGWNTEVDPQQFVAGATLGSVATVTGATVGEVVAVDADVTLEDHFARTAAVGASIFAGRSWYVDLSNVTHVGEWPAVAAPEGMELLDWSTTEQRATLACDSVVVPGTQVVDSRLGVDTVVRDVQITVEGNRFSAHALCGPRAVSRLRDSLERVAVAATKVAYARVYKYTVVADTGDSLTLQAAGGAPEMPDSVLVSKWYGAHGVTETATPGTSVVLAFLNGDPSQPIVLGYDGEPVTLTLNASGLVLVGDAPFPVAHALETITALTALGTACTAVVAAAASLNANPGTAQKSDLVTLVAALGAVQAAISAVTPTLPTTKLVAT